MKRFLIILASSIVTLPAAEYDPHSPTQQYQANLYRIEEKIRDKIKLRDNIIGELALLDYSDQRDESKPITSELKAFQAHKEVNRKKCAEELKQLKKDLKKLLKEKKRLESV